MQSDKVQPALRSRQAAGAATPASAAGESLGAPHQRLAAGGPWPSGTPSPRQGSQTWHHVAGLRPKSLCLHPMFAGAQCAHHTKFCRQPRS